MIRTSGTTSGSPRKYVIVSVFGQVIVGFGLALLLNRRFPLKGLITTLLLLPMMLSPGGCRPVLEAALRPVLGHHQLCAGPRQKLAWLGRSELALYAVALTDIWMWSPFVMLLSLAGLSAVPKHLYEAAAIDRASKPLHLLPHHAAAGRADPADRHHLPHHGSVQDLRPRLHPDGQPTTELISIRLYKMAFQEWQTGKSCALAYIVLIMVLAITNIYVKYLNKAKER
jgi:multiple sugar transport system permease protein